MSWLIYVIISLVCFVSLSLLERKIAMDTPYPRAMGIFFNGVVISFVALFYIYTAPGRVFVWPTSTQTWILTGIAVVAYGLFERGRFLAAKHLESSQFSIITNISMVVGMVGAFLLYNEAITPQKVLGSLLIIISVILVTYSKKGHGFSPYGLLVGTLVCIALGIGWIMDKQGVEAFGAELYSLLVWTLPFLILVFPGVPLKELKHVVQQKPHLTIAMALLNAIGYYTNLRAQALADATLVMPLMHTSTLWTVLLAIVILNERTHISRKLLAAVLTLVGAVLLAY